MTGTRIRRTSIMAAVAAFALVTLSGCINITYNLDVNPDATISGNVQLAVSKQAATLLGITNADDLNQKLQAGQLSDQTPTKATQDCTASEDDTNFILNCTVTNASASDLNNEWTMTVSGDTATFHGVMGSNSLGAAAGDTGSTASLPGVDPGGYELTLTYPGPISSVTGDRAVQTSSNTATVKGSLTQSLDITVVGSLTGSGSSSSKVWLYVLIAGLVTLVVIVVLLLLMRRSLKGKPDEQPALDGAAESAAIEASAPASAPAPASTDAPQVDQAPEAPQSPQEAPAPQEPQAPETPDSPQGEPQQ